MIDLSRFCDKSSSRHGLAKPFVVDGWKYATDDRIAVRVPANEKNGEGRFPMSLKGLFTSCDFSACTEKLPKLEEKLCENCECYVPCDRVVNGREYAGSILALVRFCGNVYYSPSEHWGSLAFVGNDGLQGLANGFRKDGED